MTFLIARPKEKAECTLTEFTRHGLQSEILALIDINITQDSSYGSRLNNAKPNCIVITSTYAALWLVGLLNAKSVSFDLSCTEIICVGRSTAKLIAPFVDSNHISIASPENSEGVLNLESLQLVDGKNIVLLKGQGGRNIIPRTLLARNANVIILNVYERVANIAVINGFAFERSEIKCIIATSIEIAEILISAIDKSWLQSCQWIVASERIKDYAYSMGIEHITVSQGASNKALLDSAIQLVNTGVLND